MRNDHVTSVRPQIIRNAHAEDVPLCDVEEEHEEAGVRRLARILSPQLPSKEEVDEHNLTHLPFRNWCHHCIKGTGRSADHRTHQRED